MYAAAPFFMKLQVSRKSNFFCLVMALLMALGIFVGAGTSVYASETNDTGQIEQTTLWDVEEDNNVEYDAKVIESNDHEDVVVFNSDDGPVVRKYEKIEDQETGRVKRASVARWGNWEYTNIAVTTGVLANAINAAFYAGGAAAISMFGIPGWAIAGLLGVTSWTEFGSAPGREIAKKWDKNGNGWVGFYMRKGYDGAGRHVATDYSTRQ